MHIKVEPKHISQGQRKTINKCPLALAIQTLVHPDCSIRIGKLQVNISDKKKGMTAALPPEAKQFIRDFDKGLIVYPFTLNLPLDEFKRQLNSGK